MKRLGLTKNKQEGTTRVLRQAGLWASIQVQR